MINTNDSLVAAITGVENRATFICTSQLRCCVSDFLPSAFWTCHLDDRSIFHIPSFNLLNSRSFLSQERREGRRLCLRCDRLGGSVYTKISIFSPRDKQSLTNLDFLLRSNRIL